MVQDIFKGKNGGLYLVLWHAKPPSFIAMWNIALKWQLTTTGLQYQKIVEHSWQRNTRTTANKRQQVQNFNTPEVHFVHTRSTSDAQIRKFESRNKRKVEQHRGPKDQKKLCQKQWHFNKSKIFSIDTVPVPNAKGIHERLNGLIIMTFFTFARHRVTFSFYRWKARLAYHYISLAS